MTARPVSPTGQDASTSQTRQDLADPSIWLLDRNEDLLLRHSMRKLCEEVEVTPVLSPDGVVEGLRIDRIDPRSILSSRALQPGDILRKLNGVPFNPHKAPEEWVQQLRLEEHSTYILEIERYGQIMRITYRLTDF
jgi:type II secretory pathway component PulC